MPDIIEITHMLRDTGTELARLRRTLAENPDSESLEINLLSLEKRERRLREQFDEEARLSQLDVCDYRIIPEVGASYPISGVGQSLQNFQELFTVIFDSIRNGPKRRARIRADIAEQSTFNFGYCYQGSLGFSFTVPSERLIAIESDAERAASLLLSILKSSNPEEIKSLVDTVGVASISKAYELSRTSASFGFNTRIQWRKDRALTHDVVIHVPQYDRLRQIIDETSDEKVERSTLTGRLVGLDVETGYFHLQFPEADDIMGSLAEDFRQDEMHHVPGHYTADLVKTARLHYSTGIEDESWYLKSLREAGQTEENS